MTRFRNSTRSPRAGVPFVFSTGYDKDRLLDGSRTFAVMREVLRVA
jgi:hypothetical protein